VTQTDNSAHGGYSASFAARFAWIALILATLYLCYFHNLGAIGFVGPDEPRYAWIARDMMETGDWVTPRLYGQPWFEKPPLYYWAAALSFKLFGVSEAAARFPSALAALFATLAMAWLAWRLYGPATARWLLLLLPTTVGMIGFSHAAATDMPFAASLTIAMVCAARLLGLAPPSASSTSTSFISSTSFNSLFLGFFLGLAVLAKGPAAIVLSGGAVLLWAALTRRWRDAFRCLHPIAITSFCLTALPWYILCARRNPDFFRVFIIEHNFKRFLTPEFQHIQPFWFYVPVVLIAFVPWTLALLWSAIQGMNQSWRNRQVSGSTIFLLSWAAFPLLFFSTSQSKLPGYILPALPAIGLLLVRVKVRLVDAPQWTFRWLLCAGGLASILVAAILWSLPFSASRINARAATGAGWVLSFLGIANLVLSIPPKKRFSGFLTSTLCVLPVLLILGFFNRLEADFLPWDPSGKTLARELTEKQIPLDQLYIARLHRGQDYSLSFYLHREVKIWNEGDGYLLIPSEYCGSLVSQPWVCSDKPVELASSGWFVHRVVRGDSAGGLGALGGNGGGSGTNRQPR
jgi:4-amino-4-deoxy-L-arabinose transferase-like glycosyltransferase